MPAKSKKQQQFFGIVRGMQKGETPPSGEAGQVAQTMDTDDVEKYAKTKHKGLPNKVKKEVAERVVTKLTDWLEFVNEASEAQPWSPEEVKLFDSSHDKPTAAWGVSFKKDKGGYYCHTHRARSKSRKCPSKIPKKDLTFVESTG
jgi:hypothetical protein